MANKRKVQPAEVEQAVEKADSKAKKGIAPAKSGDVVAKKVVDIQFTAKVFQEYAKERKRLANLEDQFKKDILEYVKAHPELMVDNVFTFNCGVRVSVTDALKSKHDAITPDVMSDILDRDCFSVVEVSIKPEALKNVTSAKDKKWLKAILDEINYEETLGERWTVNS